jgi:hypothetical protein
MEGMAESPPAHLVQDPSEGWVTRNQSFDRRKIGGSERVRGIEPSQPRLAKQEIDGCTTR